MCAVCAVYSNNARGDECYGAQIGGWNSVIFNTNNGRAKKTTPGTWCNDRLKCPAGCYCSGEPGYNFAPQAWKRNLSGGGGIDNTMRYIFADLCANPSSFPKRLNQELMMTLSEHAFDANNTSWAKLIGSNKNVYEKSDSEKLDLAKKLMNSIGISICPDEFPKSAEGSANAEACYVEIVSGQKVYNKRSTCSSGTYLPAGHNDCLPCKTDGVHYCPGGTFAASTKKDSGISECPKGQKANDKRGGCLSDKESVPAGSYLRANEVTPVPCKTDKNYYCPGGEYKVSKKDQGIFECPKGSRPNDTKSACKKLVSKDLMQQCFLTVADPDKYKSCLTGSRYYK